MVFSILTKKIQGQHTKFSQTFSNLFILQRLYPNWLVIIFLHVRWDTCVMLILGRQEYQTGGNLHFRANNDRHVLSVGKLICRRISHQSYVSTERNYIN